MGRPPMPIEQRRTCSGGNGQCRKRNRGDGLCAMHAERLARTGSTVLRPLTLAERFWVKVDKRGPDECWEWTGATKEGGYGVMRPEGRRHGPTIKAHRVSLIVAGVDIEGFDVLHSCDNPPCVNPAHLRPGTTAENMADAVERGRMARGSRGGTAKLTEADVVEIRRLAAAGVQFKMLATRFGVAPSNISRIVNGHAWTHVPMAAEALTGEPLELAAARAA